MTATDQPTVGVALKPCPKCHDESPEICGDHARPDDGFRFVRCTSLGCDHETHWHPSTAEAVAAWNARTPASGAVEADPELVGYAARRVGEPISNCPRVSDRGVAPAWRKGWLACDAALTSEPQLSGKTGELKSEPKAEEEARTVIGAYHPLYKAMQPSADAVEAIECLERANASALHSARDILVGSNAPQPLQGGEVTRDSIGREVWVAFTGNPKVWDRAKDGRNETVKYCWAAADAILALLSAGRGEEGVRDDDAFAGLPGALRGIANRAERRNRRPSEAKTLRIAADRLEALSLPAGGEDEALREPFIETILAFSKSVDWSAQDAEDLAVALISAARKGG